MKYFKYKSQNQKFKGLVIMGLSLTTLGFTIVNTAPQVSASQLHQSMRVNENLNSLSLADQQSRNFIAQRESGDNYTAQNGNYYGKYQLSIDLLNGDYSPANQDLVANNYVNQRYGSWVNAEQFWIQHGWY